MPAAIASRLPRITGAGVVMLLTAAALLMLVGLPLLYVVLQAIFPGWSRGELAGAFGLFVPLLSDPALLGLLGNTLRLGVAVVAVCALLAIPLGALRALARTGARRRRLGPDLPDPLHDPALHRGPLLDADAAAAGLRRAAHRVLG